MNNRRLALVAGLGVAELWIAGLMVRSVAGSGSGSGRAASPPVVLSSPRADRAKGGSTSTLRTIESGSAPRVIIDDDGAVLSVTVRPGSTVGVHEEIDCSGWFRGGVEPVGIERTADGVRIARQSGGLVFEIGSVRRQLDVVVPPQTRLDVLNAGSTTVAGLRAEASLNSDNGTITVSDHVGGLNVKSDNGRIVLRDVVAPSVDVTTDNGRVTLDHVQADIANVAADNGRIEATRSLLRGGKIQTDSGRIALGLDAQSNVTVRAHTSSGKVIAESPLTVSSGAQDSDAPATIRIGNGVGRLEVGTDNGSITILAQERNVL